MSKWPLVTLGKVAAFDRRGVSPESIRSGTSYVGLENIAEGGEIVNVTSVENGDLASSKFSFTEAHILYGKLRPYLSKIARPTFEGICSTDIIPILPGANVDRDYLTHFLRLSSSVSFAADRSVGVNLPRISPSVLATLPVPVPSLAEQRRIAAILDQAETLRAKRRQALAKLDTLTQSLFLEMFGDPVLNKMKWEQKTAIDYAKCLVPGRDKPKSFTGMTPWVTTADLQHLGYTERSRHRTGLSKDEITEVRARLVPKASVLLTCVGDLGVVSISRSDMVINQQLHSFQMCNEMVEEFFMYALAFQKNYMYRNASQTTLPYMNKTICNKIPMIRPPKGLQIRFAEAVRAVDLTRCQCKQSLKDSENLMAALTRAVFGDGFSQSSNFFRGEL